jgi:hypothetical protein
MHFWFGSILYSFLLALLGFLIILDHRLSYLLCLFISIGVIIERLWSIFEKLNIGDSLEYLFPLTLVLFCLIYCGVIRDEKSNKYKLKTLSIIIVINLSIIFIGKMILPN